MSLSAEAVTKILETRFDWYSARAVLRQAVERIGAPTGGPFDAKALNGIADALPALATHVEATAAALRQAAEAAPSKAPAPKAAPEPPAAANDAQAGDASPSGVAAEGGGEEKRDAKKKK